MATSIVREEAGVYTCKHDDKWCSAEKRRLRAGKAQVVKANGSKAYPRLYLTELDFRWPPRDLEQVPRDDMRGKTYTLYKFGKSYEDGRREVGSDVIKFYGWSESSVFDFYTENATADVVLGDAVCMLMDSSSIEVEVKDILMDYCWGGVHKAAFGALNGYTETSLLPMILAEHVMAKMRGITSWLGEISAELDELQKLLTSGSETAEARKKTKELAKRFCSSLETLVSDPKTPPPPPLEPVFRCTIEQKFSASSIPLLLKDSLEKLASDENLALMPIGVTAKFLKGFAQGTVVRQRDVFPNRSATLAASPSSSADALALMFGGAGLSLQSSRGAGVHPVVVARASLGSAIPMARAPMPRMSDGALLPRALAGPRISSGAAAHVPPRKSRPSTGAPGVPARGPPKTFEFAR